MVYMVDPTNIQGITLEYQTQTVSFEFIFGSANEGNLQPNSLFFLRFMLKNVARFHPHRGLARPQRVQCDYATAATILQDGEP